MNLDAAETIEREADACHGGRRFRHQPLSRVVGTNPVADFAGSCPDAIRKADAAEQLAGAAIENAVFALLRKDASTLNQSRDLFIK